MDSIELQMQKGEYDRPTLLLQYCYYLNSAATKQVIVGFDSETFRPYVVLMSLCEKSYLFFSVSNWSFVIDGLDKCEKYLKYKKENVWGVSADDIFQMDKVESDDCNTRQIKIANVVFNCEILFGLEEIETLIQLSSFLSRILNHYNDKWGYVKEFYRAYLIECCVGDENKFSLKQFFSIKSPSVNYFRLFNEIPVICRNKLKNDLEEINNSPQ